MIFISDIIVKGVPFKKVTVNNETISTCQDFKDLTERFVKEKKYYFLIELNSLLGTSIVRILHDIEKQVRNYGCRVYVIADDQSIRELLFLVQVDRIVPIFCSEEHFVESFDDRKNIQNYYTEAENNQSKIIQ